MAASERRGGFDEASRALRAGELVLRLRAGGREGEVDVEARLEELGGGDEE